MQTHLPLDCRLVFLSLEWAACVMQKLRVSLHLDVIARLLTDLETRLFGILLFHRSRGLHATIAIREIEMRAYQSGRMARSEIEALAQLSSFAAVEAILNTLCSHVRRARSFHSAKIIAASSLDAPSAQTRVHHARTLMKRQALLRV